MEKKCLTCGDAFVVKSKQIFCSRKCANIHPETKAKNRRNQVKTFLKRYNGHPMRTEKTLNAFKTSMLEKHGVDHPYKLTDKIKYTKHLRYNDGKYNNREKSKMTCIKKYGVDNVKKSSVYREKNKQLSFEEIKSSLMRKNINLLSCKIGKNIYNENHELECNRCKKTFVSTLYKHEDINCPFCEPIVDPNVSLHEYLKSIIPEHEIEKNNNKILYGKIIDFYIPYKKIAIDIVKLNTINKNYLMNKMKACATHGVKLIQIFEDEWIYQKEIIKSILCKSLNVSIINKNTEKYSVCEISNTEKNTFLNINHIQKADKSSVRIGLFINNNLTSVMTFSKSRRNKNYEYEMLRYTDELYTVVDGSMKKMLNYFVEKYKPKSIITYNDRRYFPDEQFVWLNFNFIKNTDPSHYYVSLDKKHRLSWIMFQKNRLEKILEKYDANLTEQQNMKMNNFDVVYNCGYSVWGWSS
jgi:predicted nucleic acid-binding Zn ribbon protein